MKTGFQSETKDTSQARGLEQTAERAGHEGWTGDFKSLKCFAK